MSVKPVTARTSILAALSHGPNYGAGIEQLLWDATGTRLHPGSLYTQLAKLEREKLIRPWHGDTNNQAGTPPAYVYLTVEGWGVLREHLAVLRATLALGSKS